jgi:hypothetical protein
MAIMKEIAGVVSRKKPAAFDQWIRAFSYIRDKCGDTLIPKIWDDRSDTASQEEDEALSDNEDAQAQAHDNKQGQDKDQGKEKGDMSRAEVTEDAPNATERASFTIPAPVRMRFARNRVVVSARQKLMEKIKRDAAALMYRESIPRTDYSLADVQAAIENKSYCFSDAMPLVRIVSALSVLTTSHRIACLLRFAQSRLNGPPPKLWFVKSCPSMLWLMPRLFGLLWSSLSSSGFATTWTILMSSLRCMQVAITKGTSCSWAMERRA